MLEHAALLLTLAISFGLMMAFAVGANDVANAMGTSIGSGAITMNQAIIIAIIFEALGALIASGQVTNTIGRDLISFSHFAQNPEVLALGMISALLSSGIWLLLASNFGWPVSTTHTIVGAVIGFATVCFGVSYVSWHVVTNIVLSWFLTPLFAGILAFLLFKSVHYFVLDHKDPIAKARDVVPVFVFMVAFVISLVTLKLGLKPLGWHISNNMVFVYSAIFSVICTIAAAIWLRCHYQTKTITNLSDSYEEVERYFGLLTVITACAMAFAHGSNDTANAIGPVATVVNIVHFGPQFVHNQSLPFWVVIMGAVGLALGLAIFGYKVIQTVGNNITNLTPTRGFVAQLSTASVVVVSSGYGLPVSTTQVLVGALLGVGMARGIGAINLKVVRSIFLSWLITVPAGAIGSIICFYLLKTILSL